MKIERAKVEKVTITGAPALDPITVVLEDIGPRQGKIIIECYGKSWSAYWGGCGDKGVAAFFCSCNEDYLANCLERGINRTEYDAERVEDVMKQQVIRRRRQASNWIDRDWEIEPMDKAEARKWWKRIEREGFFDDPMGNSKLFADFYGEEWWSQIPEAPNHEYEYLCRIIKAVQQALTCVARQPEEMAA